MLTSGVILYGSLACCTLTTAGVVRRYDLHAREPWWALTVALLLGAGGMHLAGLVQIAFIHAVNNSGALVSDPMLAMCAGVTEELAKFLATGAMILIARRHFDEPLDGLIYGAFAGLGAAVEESLSMLSARQGASMALPPEEVVRLAGHLVMGGIGGYGWGLAAARCRGWRGWMAGSLAGAALLHTLWDVVAFDAQARQRAQEPRVWMSVVLSVGLMLAGLIAFRWLVTQGDRKATPVAIESAKSSSRL